MSKASDFWKKRILTDKTMNGSFAVMIALLLLFTVYSYTRVYSRNGFDAHAYVELSDGWTQVLTDGRSRTLGRLPVYLGDKAGQTVEVYRTLPETFPTDSPVLFVKANHQTVSVRLKGREIYYYKFWSLNNYDIDYPPTQWLVVPLGSEAAGATLSISFTRVQDDRSDTVSRIYLGEKADIIFAMARHNAVPLLCSVIPLTLGAVFLVRQLFAPTRKKNYRNLYVGAVLLLLPTWMICNSEARQLIFSNIPYARNLEFISLMLLPVPVILSVNYSEQEKYTDTARGLCAGIVLADIIVLCRALWGGRSLLGQLWIILLTLLAAVLFIVVSFWKIAMSDRELFRLLRVAAFSYGALAVAGVAEYVDLVFFNGRYSGISISVGVVVYSVSVTFEQFYSQRQMTQLAQRAEMESRAKSEFLASMSHEIRTPINAIIGMDEMILREATESNVIGYASDIQQAGRHLLTIINDILDIARIEAGHMEISEVAYNLPSLLTDVIDLIQVQADDKKLAFETKLPDDMPEQLYGDASRIRQICINLLSNAVK